MSYKTYSNGFKARMVARMAGPERISAHALSAEVGVTQSTLSRWLRNAGSVDGMQDDQPHDKSRPNNKRTAEDKLRIVLEASALPDADLGAYLRREGVHEAQLAEWRDAVLRALDPPKSKPPKNSREAKRIRELEKDLRRKEKALAEVGALLALKKKVQEIWGDEDDATGTGSAT